MPLANILAPQLIRRAHEIENEIGPPRPIASGYLQAGAPAKAAPAVDPVEMKQRKDAEATARRPEQVFKNASLRGFAKERRVEKIRLPEAVPQPGDPRATATADVVGMHEDGRPIYASEPAPKPVKKKKKGEHTIIKLDPKAAVGTTESGQAVAAGGKNLGYLKSENPTRTLERRKLDVPVGEKNAYDKYGVQVLQERFGPHLKAMQENRDADGMPTDQFPPGYFKGMPAQGVEEIRQGVARLRELERGTPI